MSNGQPRPPALNFNSVLITICVAISGWTLQKVSTLGEQQATGIEKDATMEREIVDVRARTAMLEMDVKQLQIRYAALLATVGESR